VQRGKDNLKRKHTQVKQREQATGGVFRAREGPINRQYEQHNRAVGVCDSKVVEQLASKIIWLEGIIRVTK
jgi:hypothetical protein